VTVTAEPHRLSTSVSAVRLPTTLPAATATQQTVSQWVTTRPARPC
jgi:hypothetical protein